MLTEHAAPPCIAGTGSGFSPLLMQSFSSPGCWRHNTTTPLTTMPAVTRHPAACKRPSHSATVAMSGSSCWLCICWLFPVVAIERRCAAPAAGCWKPHHAGGMGG